MYQQCHQVLVSYDEPWSIDGNPYSYNVVLADIEFVPTRWEESYAKRTIAESEFQSEHHSKKSKNEPDQSQITLIADEATPRATFLPEAEDSLPYTGIKDSELVEELTGAEQEQKRANSSSGWRSLSRRFCFDNKLKEILQNKPDLIRELTGAEFLEARAKLQRVSGYQNDLHIFRIVNDEATCHYLNPERPIKKESLLKNFRNWGFHIVPQSHGRDHYIFQRDLDFKYHVTEKPKVRRRRLLANGDPVTPGGTPTSPSLGEITVVSTSSIPADGGSILDLVAADSLASPPVLGAHSELSTLVRVVEAETSNTLHSVASTVSSEAAPAAAAAAAAAPAAVATQLATGPSSGTPTATPFASLLQLATDLTGDKAEQATGQAGREQQREGAGASEQARGPTGGSEGVTDNHEHDSTDDSDGSMRIDCGD